MFELSANNNRYPWDTRDTPLACDNRDRHTHEAKTDKSVMGQQTNKQKEREMFEFSVDTNRYP